MHIPTFKKIIKHGQTIQLRAIESDNGRALMGCAEARALCVYIEEKRQLEIWH